MSQANDIHSSCRRAKSYAWAKYYEAMTRRANEAVRIIRFLPVPRPPRNGEAPPPADIPPHITQEFYDMAVALRKEFNCPICFDMVTGETIKITTCGHIYCSTCLATLRTQQEPKCAVCRRSVA
jgi:hypothetical protein